MSDQAVDIVLIAGVSVLCALGAGLRSDGPVPPPRGTFRHRYWALPAWAVAFAWGAVAAVVALPLTGFFSGTAALTATLPALLIGTAAYRCTWNPVATCGWVLLPVVTVVAVLHWRAEVLHARGEHLEGVVVLREPRSFYHNGSQSKAFHCELEYRYRGEIKRLDTTSRDQAWCGRASAGARLPVVVDPRGVVDPGVDPLPEQRRLPLKVSLAALYTASVTAAISTGHHRRRRHARRESTR